MDVDVVVHAYPDCWHVTGGSQTPLDPHTSVVVQQGNAAEQAWPVLAQVGTLAATQVPLVAPAGTSQTLGVQQSPFVVQDPDSGTHAAPQVPLAAPDAIVQMPLQQSAPATQVAPWTPQAVPVGSAQWPVASQSPEQHWLLDVQAFAVPVPVGVHVPGVGGWVAGTQ